MARVLGRIRLSREKKRSTSVARQKQYIEDWATSEGHTVIGWAIDINTSGAVSPFKTPEFGNWLNNRSYEFDIIACWKMDRLSRRTVHSYALMSWCKDNGKLVKATNDEIDPMSRVGELLWFILAWLGEGELEAIQDRALGTYQHLVSVGRWRGGKVPYGYRAVRADKGYCLEIDEEAAEILRDMVARIIAGQSTNSVIDDLNERRVHSPGDRQKYNNNLNPTPGEPLQQLTGVRWSLSPTLRMLRSRRMLGQWETQGNLVRDDDGMPLQIAEPIVARDDWYALQERLKTNSRKAPNRVDGNALLGVAFCGKCEHQLYANTGRGRKKLYRCGSRMRGRDQACGELSFSADELEAIVGEYFLERVGHIEVVSKRFVQGTNHSEELAQRKDAMATLLHDLTGMTSAAGKAILMEQIGALDERIATLESLPNSDPGWVSEGTGETYAEYWERLEERERTAMLRETGVRALIKRVDGNQVCALVLPADLEARVAAGPRGNTLEP